MFEVACGVLIAAFVLANLNLIVYLSAFLLGVTTILAIVGLLVGGAAMVLSDGKVATAAVNTVANTAPSAPGETAMWILGAVGLLMVAGAFAYVCRDK